MSAPLPHLGNEATAVITGAAMGIGEAAAAALAARGMALVLVDLPGAGLRETAERLGCADGLLTVLELDITDPDASTRIRKAAAGTGRPVRLLLNNAVTRIGKGHDAPLDDWRRAVEVNLWAPVTLCRDLLPLLAEPAHIVNVGSKQGITNPPGHPVYNMTKSALKTYTEALAHELRTSRPNVSVHLLVPGWTTTQRKAHQPGAWLPEQVVAEMLEGVARNDFYILCPDNEVTLAQDHRRIRWAADDNIEGRPALSRWHPDHADDAKDKGV
ncbi:MAG: SDR family oxidoreductase [Pseudomonadota bacterium]